MNNDNHILCYNYYHNQNTKLKQHIQCWTKIDAYVCNIEGFYDHADHSTNGEWDNKNQVQAIIIVIIALMMESMMNLLL